MAGSVNVHEAKTHFSKLLARVAAGTDEGSSSRPGPWVGQEQNVAGARFRRALARRNRRPILQVTLLLDTNVFLWWTLDEQRLSVRSRQVLRDGKNRLLLSVGSAWELVIKWRLGKLQIPDEPSRFLREQLTINRIEELPIVLNHVVHVETLPDHHRDPFDRILIAQSLVENVPVVTADEIFLRYGVEVLW